jgi:hypothetical protein
MGMAFRIAFGDGSKDQSSMFGGTDVTKDLLEDDVINMEHVLDYAISTAK